MEIETRQIEFEDWTLRLRPPGSAPVRVMLMLHGLTGDENSMWVFAKNLPPQYWLVAPRAPYPANPFGYSWRTAGPRAGEYSGIEDLRGSAGRLVGLLDRWSAANAVDAGQVDVIGFSQGAALGIAFALLHPGRVRKLGVLSGFAPRGSEQFVAPQTLLGKPIFMAHGVLDETVPIEGARKSAELLRQAGGQVTYCESQVGHKVGAECRRAMEDFFLG